MKALRLRVAAFAIATFGLPLAAAPPEAASTPPVDPVDLIRHVVRSQRRVEGVFEGATYDEREVQIAWDAKGRPSKVQTRLFYVLSAESGGLDSRELVEVDGRPATEDEKRKAAEQDEKARKRRLEQKAAEKARRPPPVSDDDDDPLVGSRRLSELIGRYTIRVVGEEVVEGRPAWVLDFTPDTHAAPPKTLGDRALNALEGRAVIDAATFQVRSVEAHLTRAVKIAGGLAANVKDAGVAYTGQLAGGDFWFPCTVDLRLSGKTALFFRLDTSFRVEFTNLRRFYVETETDIRPEADSGSNR